MADGLVYGAGGLTIDTFGAYSGAGAGFLLETFTDMISTGILELETFLRIVIIG